MDLFVELLNLVLFMLLFCALILLILGVLFPDAVERLRAQIEQKLLTWMGDE